MVNAPREKWSLTAAKLPCRLCTDDPKNVEGKEIWKPTSSFTTLFKGEDLLRSVLSKGQDLHCYECDRKFRNPKRKELTEAAPENEDTQKKEAPVFCNGSCQQSLPQYYFDQQKLQHWKTFKNDFRPS